MCFSENDFDADFRSIKAMFPDIDDNLIGCYLCNFEDRYICNEYNGGCKSLSRCQEIHKQIK